MRDDEMDKACQVLASAGARLAESMSRVRDAATELRFPLLDMRLAIESLHGAPTAPGEIAESTIARAKRN